MSTIIGWFSARLVPIGAGVLVIIGVIVWDQVRISRAENRGAEKLATKVERKDNAAAESIRDADAKSRAAAPGRLRGVVRDPNAVSQ